ncbi:HpcH/HpaI aldolase/citrate lyase family protein [Paraburkholderia sp.]|uniref:HpcH/HpaI aldolase/citrate lyase family protein n=1 Tax=Paraburkholderia sp. TaxID=1926495 RepID=UPI003D6F0141
MTARSYLFVPGNRPERFEKARAAGADAVILDLEDAVPPDAKPAARAAVLAHVDATRPEFVRINSADTPWFADDVAALAGHPGVAGIVLPKAESRDQIGAVAAHAHAQLAVLPIVETAVGIAGIAALCEAPKVPRVLFGTLDFQIDLNLEGDGDELLFFRSQIVLASRLAGIDAPVDGVSTALDDPVAIEFEARRARRLGFGGKLCIHPKQIDAVHRAYAWTDDEKAWAARVLAAVHASGGSAVAVDGKMVDMPVILKAQRITGR